MTTKRRTQVQRLYSDTVDACIANRGQLDAGDKMTTAQLIDAFAEAGIDGWNAIEACKAHRGLLGRAGESLKTPQLLDAFVRVAIDALETERKEAELPFWRRLDPRRRR